MKMAEHLNGRSFLLLYQLVEYATQHTGIEVTDTKLVSPFNDTSIGCHQDALELLGQENQIYIFLAVNNPLSQGGTIFFSQISNSGSLSRF